MSREKYNKKTTKKGDKFMHFRLKELREKLELTQQKMAEKMQVSQPLYARLENGERQDPRASTIIKICKTFNVSADWLLGLKDDIKS